MTSYLLDFVNQLDDKWNEVDLLLQEASRHEESNSPLYNALCRSVTVLLVAHLEGFLKDLVKATIQDVNHGYSFDQIPKAMQRTYCRKYLDEGKDSGVNESRTLALINKFSEIKCSISYEPFLSASNKNPKPHVIKTIFQNFGIKNIFQRVHGSTLDEVFSDSDRAIKEKIIQSKNHLNKSISQFPYSTSLDRLELKDNTKANLPKRTMWEEFLDQINQKRHEVAHGNDFANGESIGVLKSRKNKVVYLQLELVTLITSSLSKDDND